MLSHNYVFTVACTSYCSLILYNSQVSQGQYLGASGISHKECPKKCSQTPGCIAVNYNQNSRQCFFVKSFSPAPVPGNRPGVMHFRYCDTPQGTKPVVTQPPPVHPIVIPTSKYYICDCVGGGEGVSLIFTATKRLKINNMLFLRQYRAM